MQSRDDDKPTPSATESEGTPGGVEPAAEAKPFSSKRVVRSGATTIVAFGIANVLRFGSNLILTRLVAQDTFGVVMLVYAVWIGIEQFSDLGVGANIIHSKRGEEAKFRHTAWTVQILRGLLVWAVTAAIAPLVGNIYPDYSGLGSYIQVLAICSLITGTESISLHILGRNLSVARVAILHLGAQILSTTTMIVWACYDPTPWAMVAGAVVSALATTIATHIWYGGDRLGWDRQSVREIFSFGKWVFVSSGLVFLASQADRFLFGSFVSPETLGVYSLGLQVAIIVPMLASKLLSSVAFPVYCRAVQLQLPLEPVFLRARRPILLLGAWGLSGLCGGGQSAISFLYRPEYAEAGWMLKIIGVGAWFGIVLGTTRTSVLIALGALRQTSLTAAVKLCTTIVFIPLGFYIAGFPGAVAGYALSDIVKYLHVTWACRMVGLGGLREDMVFTLWFGIAYFVSWVSANAFELWGYHPWVQCLAVFVVATLVWIPKALPQWRDLRGLLSPKAA